MLRAQRVIDGRGHWVREYRGPCPHVANAVLVEMPPGAGGKTRMGIVSWEKKVERWDREKEGKKKKTRKKGLTVGTPVEKWVQSPPWLYATCLKVTPSHPTQGSRTWDISPQLQPWWVDLPQQTSARASNLLLPGVQTVPTWVTSGGGVYMGWVTAASGTLKRIARAHLLSRGGQPCQGILRLGQIPVDNSALPHHRLLQEAYLGPFHYGSFPSFQRLQMHMEHSKIQR